jgi:tRNA 2-thiocytidine biosynthesis protein TtcA
MIPRSPADTRLLERFAHHVGRGINRFSMIGPGDRVLIGVSGGKDSLAMSLALVERKRWVPVDYELAAVQVEWLEYPMSDGERETIDRFYEELGIPLNRIRASIHPSWWKRGFSCYTCARNRKRLIFDEAARLGFRTIALGHNLDDIAETTMINLFFRGEFSTMMPVQRFFGGKVEIIRPMCEVRAAEVARVARRLGLPVVPSRCPNAEKNQRSLMREILRQVSRVDRHAATNIYGAAWRINREYLPAAETAPGAQDPPAQDDESRAEHRP